MQIIRRTVKIMPSPVGKSNMSLTKFPEKVDGALLETITMSIK